MSCLKCGQANIADGGIGCTCNACKKCNSLGAGKSGYCFLCGPCGVCGKSVQMHTTLCKKTIEISRSKNYAKYEYSVLALCEELHMQKTGAGDPFSDLKLKEVIDALKYRLKKWTEPSSPYDLAVKNLILSVLVENDAI